MDKKCWVYCCEQKDCRKHDCCEKKEGECHKPESEKQQRHVHQIEGSVVIAENRYGDKCDYPQGRFDEDKREGRCEDKCDDRCEDKREKCEKMRKYPHNHRFSTVSGEAIPISSHDHVHEVEFKTDFIDGHYHTFKGKSSGIIRVGEGRHVHFAKAFTSVNNGHSHEFMTAALIDDPIGK